MAFQSNYGLSQYQKQDDQFTGFQPGDAISNAFGGELGQVGAVNQEMGTAFSESAIAGQSKWRQAKDMADAYRRQVDEQRSASKNKGILGGLLGIGSTIASFIPGGQIVGAALGVGAKAFG